MNNKMRISLIAVFIIMAAFIALPHILFKSPEIEVDINKYGEILAKLRDTEDVNSGLYIFPEYNYYLTDLKYESKDGIFDGSYYLFVTAEYNEAEWENELTRIENIQVQYKNISKGLIHTNLRYDTYIAIYDGYGTYEYILLDEANHKIAYVFNQSFGWNVLDIKPEYKLNNYTVPQESRDPKNKGYNMYYTVSLDGKAIRFDKQNEGN